MSKHLSWSRYFSLNPDSISSKDNSERVSANSCQGNLLLVFLIRLIPVSTQVVLVTLSGMAESRTIPKGFDIFFFIYISIYYIYAINTYLSGMVFLATRRGIVEISIQPSLVLITTDIKQADTCVGTESDY